jgi:two-component system, OmpR family, phosphate regulon sensor histidine kinase PhoR
MTSVLILMTTASIVAAVFVISKFKKLSDLLNRFLEKRGTAFGLPSSKLSWNPFRIEQSLWSRLADIEHAEQIHDRDIEKTKFLLEALLQGLMEGVVVVDSQFKVKAVNRSAVEIFQLGNKTEGLTLMEVFRSGSLCEMAQRVVKEGKVLNQVFEIISPMPRSFEVNIASIRDASDDFVGAVLVFHDKTRLRHLETTRKEFVADISHEIRTPLSILRGYVETLDANPDIDLDQRKKFLGIMSRHVHRISALVNDLLLLSKLESKVSGTRAAIAFDQLIEESLDDFQQVSRQKRISLRSEVSAPLPTVEGDAGELRQAIDNLIDNALKYSDEHSEIVLHASGKENHLIVSVNDQGAGIPEQDLPHIFERFYRVDKSRSRGAVNGKGGTGLGLSIVEQIVKRHGGRIWVESELGKGSKFTFSLPSMPQGKSSPAGK